MLTPADPVPVPFRGERSARGPLTLGQLNTAKWLEDAPYTPAARLDQRLPVPPGTPLPDVVAALSALLARHEALRSRYILGDPGEQHVLAAGEVPLAIFRVTNDSSPDEVAAELAALGREKPIDPAVDSPVRFCAAVRDDAVAVLVAVYSHLAVDFQALMVLARDFADPPAGAPAVQPLDRAAAEASPSRRRRQDQALRHWVRHLSAAPAHLYARPRDSAGRGSGACGMSSAAAAHALDHIAARTRVSRPTIVMAALCALLAHRTGYGTLRFVMLSANRFESDLRDYVGTLAQSTYVALDTAGAGFDELVRRCFGAVLQAGVNGAYHVYRQHERSAEINAERGIAPSFEPLFNSVVVDTRGFDPPPPRPAPAPTRLAWMDLPPTDILLRFDLGRVDDELVARVWTGDTGRVTRGEATDLLLALERLLVTAARGDLDPPAVARAVALPPLPRPDGWHLIDGCWIDLAEVQRLLDDALSPSAARARVEDGRLTAYLADHLSADAEGARARCRALLAGRHAAMVPHRFVSAPPLH
ncbi:condensation domain-containing protein [Dactylosporangium sp. CA-233914]|uniref:condensation domain-containing protein n=1 Tax=Dactylosporangium sp. CA-233914 TaxID=3239934 RepID=UPI003D931014